MDISIYGEDRGALVRFDPRTKFIVFLASLAVSANSFNAAAHELYCFVLCVMLFLCGKKWNAVKMALMLGLAVYVRTCMEMQATGAKLVVTIYNNIAMGSGASREAVIEAAKKARCYEFIMSLPYGFDTIIGEGGATMSGGEAQRISIARCILKNAPIIILDEATANIDADNERSIQEAMSELCRNKTVLVIAHRLYTIANADKIIVIDKGRIAEQGTREELLLLGGIYSRMEAANA